MNADDRLVARFGLLSIHLERVKAAHALAEDALGRHDTRIDEWYAENLRRDPNDAEFIDFLRNVQKEDVTQGYPFVLRSALFAAAYGALEHFLTSVCRYFETKVAGPGLADLRGEGIQRAHLFLVKVARASVPDSNEWHSLLLYGKLRNALVHAQGDLSQSRSLQEIKNLAGRVKTFAVVDSDTRVELAASFTPSFVATVETFSGQLDEALSRHTFAS